MPPAKKEYSLIWQRYYLELYNEADAKKGQY